jgi:hypothetical protein
MKIIFVIFLILLNFFFFFFFFFFFLCSSIYYHSFGSDHSDSFRIPLPLEIFMNSCV